MLAGHLAPALIHAVEAFTSTLPKAAAVEVLTETAPSGTGGALLGAAARLDDRFLLCNGDSLFDANLAPLLADAAADPPSVLARLLLRRADDASRYGAVTLEDDRIRAFSERPKPSSCPRMRVSTTLSAPKEDVDTRIRGHDGGEVVNAGVYAVDRRILARLSPTCSLERDILPALAAEGALRGTMAAGWFIDIGVPEDLARARAELTVRLARPALFLDRDGVLNVERGHVGTRDRFEWMTGARDAVRHASNAGWHVFVVTNQSGVGRGFYDEHAVRALLGWMEDEIRLAGGTIDDARYCPFIRRRSLPNTVVSVTGASPERACCWTSLVPGASIRDAACWWATSRPTWQPRRAPEWRGIYSRAATFTRSWSRSSGGIPKAAGDMARENLEQPARHRPDGAIARPARRPGA